MLLSLSLDCVDSFLQTEEQKEVMVKDLTEAIVEVAGKEVAWVRVGEQQAVGKWETAGSWETVGQLEAVGAWEAVGHCEAVSDREAVGHCEAVSDREAVGHQEAAGNQEAVDDQEVPRSSKLEEATVVAVGEGCNMMEASLMQTSFLSP